MSEPRLLARPESPSMLARRLEPALRSSEGVRKLPEPAVRSSGPVRKLLEAAVARSEDVRKLPGRLLKLELPSGPRRSSSRPMEEQEDGAPFIEDCTGIERLPEAWASGVVVMMARAEVVV